MSRREEVDMRDGRHRLLSGMIAFLLPSSLLAAPSVNVGNVLEKGFKAHSTSCFEITQPQGLGWVVRHATCGPGGAWGPYVYVSLTNAFDPFATGGVVRLDGHGRITDTGLTARVPGHFDFSSAGGPWGDRLWLWNSNATTTLPPNILGCSSDGTSCDSSCAGPYSYAFDRSGDFNYALYTSGPQGIVRLTDPHNCTLLDPPPLASPNYELFSSAQATPIAFGPGGIWGNSLYAAPGTIVLPDGTYSTFGFPFGNLTWATGASSASWNGDMFARLSGGNPGDVYRVKPNGTATLFATDLPGEMTFCNDGLWVITNGACTEIDATGPK
jgi:hypothetical protein